MNFREVRYPSQGIARSVKKRSQFRIIGQYIINQWDRISNSHIYAVNMQTK